MHIPKLVSLLTAGVLVLSAAVFQPRPAEAATTILLTNLTAASWGTYAACATTCAQQELAVGFVTPASPAYTVTQVSVNLQKIQSGPYTPTVELWSNAGGSPGALLSTLGMANVSVLFPLESLATFNVNIPLTPSTTYFIVLNGNTTTVQGGWRFINGTPGSYTGAFSYAGSFDRIGVGSWGSYSNEFQLELLEIITPVVLVAAGIPVPNLGLVMITGDQAQPAYNTPNGLIAHASNGAEIWLPADADGNWYDTYVVADVQEVDGEIWLGLFIGNTHWGYVRLADVTVIVPIQGLE